MLRPLFATFSPPHSSLKYSSLCIEYRRASEILISKAISNNNVDTIGHALLFLIRHSVELGLKANLEPFYAMAGKVELLDIDDIKEHSLSYYFDIFQSIVQVAEKNLAISPDLIKGRREIMADLKLLVGICHKLDPSSHMSRYGQYPPLDFSKNEHQIDFTSFGKLYSDVMTDIFIVVDTYKAQSLTPDEEATILDEINKLISDN
ncbi:hypothetical protein [uncultured Imperialibacter sp.]|uniref:hypothetical protein n=1 Tax=uncultured Imperialibacter sp. TaxID=1672639 RepID=UPI0030DD0301|tara:strand:+ start:7646 stop:8260 length:615 start_codon:yes stop_codon:yes gene_type:complete